MIDPVDLHEYALTLVDKANGLEGPVSESEERALLERALNLESEAAQMLEGSELGAVRGLIYQSAIYVASRVENWSWAESLASSALAGVLSEKFKVMIETLRDQASLKISEQLEVVAHAFQMRQVEPRLVGSRLARMGSKIIAPTRHFESAPEKTLRDMVADVMARFDQAADITTNPKIGIPIYAELDPQSNTIGNVHPLFWGTGWSPAVVDFVAGSKVDANPPKKVQSVTEKRLDQYGRPIQRNAYGGPGEVPNQNVSQKKGRRPNKSGS